MVESLQVSAQLTTVVEVDVTKIARLRDRAKARLRGPRGRQAVVPAVLRAGRRRGAEGAPDGQREHRRATRDHLPRPARTSAIAVDTERGLLVPVIQDAGDLNIAGLARKIADLAERTRNNKIGPDELAGGTFTLTNTGSRGALFDTPIINQPQVGDPRHRRGRQAPGRRHRRRRRRDDRDPLDGLPGAVATTTGSSTAPTRRGSSSR